ncbi:MAG TPA: type II secretion system protein GspG [Candidatus Omnitrophica bacterium]|nr:type II secretion system protein GspG [Candidatus Omnitrophota bacterium]
MSRLDYTWGLKTQDSRLKRKNRSSLGSRVSGFGSTQGFTLVEIMLVVIIIGVLAGMVLPRFAGRTEQAKMARARVDVAAIGTALDLHELDLGSYPKKLEELVLASAPSGVDESVWHGPYLKKGLPKDPWGRDYQYECLGEPCADYKLFSIGPNGTNDGGKGDDVTSWE